MHIEYNTCHLNICSSFDLDKQMPMSTEQEEGDTVFDYK